MYPALKEMRGEVAPLEKKQEWLLQMLELETSVDEVWASFLPLNGGDCTVSQRIREKKQRAFDEAQNRGDILTALMHRPIRDRNSTNGEEWMPVLRTLVCLRDYQIQLIGLQSALRSLKKISKSAADIRVSHFMDSFGACEIDEITACHRNPQRCRPRGMENPVRSWVHCNHALFNRAVWELCRVFGFGRMRCALRNDIKAKDFKQEILGPGWGKYFEKTTSQVYLDHFLKASPSPAWVRIP